MGNHHAVASKPCKLALERGRICRAVADQDGMTFVVEPARSRVCVWQGPGWPGGGFSSGTGGYSRLVPCFLGYSLSLLNPFYSNFVLTKLRGSHTLTFQRRGLPHGPGAVATLGLARVESRK